MHGIDPEKPWFSFGLRFPPLPDISINGSGFLSEKNLRKVLSLRLPKIVEMGNREVRNHLKFFSTKLPVFPLQDSSCGRARESTVSIIGFNQPSDVRRIVPSRESIFSFRTQQKFAPLLLFSDQLFNVSLGQASNRLHILDDNAPLLLWRRKVFNLGDEMISSPNETLAENGASLAVPPRRDGSLPEAKSALVLAINTIMKKPVEDKEAHTKVFSLRSEIYGRR